VFQGLEFTFLGQGQMGLGCLVAFVFSDMGGDDHSFRYGHLLPIAALNIWMLLF
jgi:hypothetical protein